MANELPNRAVTGLFVPTETVDPPFTDRIVAQQGVSAFQRVDTGQYLVTLQRPLAFSEGYADASLPPNMQAVAGAQLSEDGSQVLISVLALGTGVPVDPPIVGLTVWAIREGEGEGPAIPFPAIPPPIPGGAGVIEWNGRTGLVLPQAGDYAATQITNDSAVAGASVADALDNLELAAATKDRWFEAETNGQNAGHRIRNVGASGNFDFNFVAPPDFDSLVSLQMWGASRTATNPAAPITLTSSYGAVGETPTTEGAGNGITPAFTAGILFAYDISSVFGNLAAGDMCGVNVDHGGIGGTVDYYGIYMRYLTP